MPRSSKRVELKMGNGNGMLVTNLGVVWKLLSGVEIVDIGDRVITKEDRNSAEPE